MNKQWNIKDLVKKYKSYLQATTVGVENENIDDKESDN